MYKDIGVMLSEQFIKMLDSHRRWLNGEKDGRQLILRGGKLSRVHFVNFDLRCADLRRADLSYAELEYTNFSCADLTDADLRFANLSHAILIGADLRGADLRGADLRFADLRGAKLDYTYITFLPNSKGAIIDKRIAKQLASHFYDLECDDEDFNKLRKSLRKFAKKKIDDKVNLSAGKHTYDALRYSINNLDSMNATQKPSVKSTYY